MLLRLTLFFFIFSSLTAGSQEIFSGRLSYSIQYMEVPDDMKGVEDKLPSEVKIITNGKSWRSEQNTEINGDYTQLYIAEKDSIYETITIGPERVQVSYRRVQQVEVKSMNSPGPKVLDLETVICEISGDEGTEQSIVQLKSYPAIPRLFFDGLSGIPTLIETENSGLKMRLQLILIDKEPIDETYFVLPNDYLAIDTALYQSWLR